MALLKLIYSNKIVKNIISLGAATLISAALAFIVGIFTRNILGPEKYGYWLTISLIFTFIPLFQLGTVNAMNREVPFFKARNDIQKVNEIKNLTLSFIFTIPLVAVFIMVLISLFVFYTDFRYEYKTGLLYSSVLAILMFLSSYVEMFYKSEQNFTTASKVIATKSIAQSILTILFVHLYGYVGLFFGMGFAIIIQLFVGKSSFSNFKYQFNLAKYTDLIKVGFPISLVGMVWSFLIASDRVIISIFMTPEELGNYGVGMLIFNSMMLIPQVIGQVFYPKIVELVSKENFRSIYNLFWKVNSILAIGMGLIVGFLYFMFPWFVKTFMPDYIGGIFTGQILILGIYPLTLMGYAANYFNATKNQTVYLKIQFLAILLNIGLSLIFLFINSNITSVALATSLSYSIYFLTMNYYFIKKIREAKRLLLNG